jgi:hypothetical protein
MAQFAKIGNLIINLDQVLLASADDLSNTQGYRVVFALRDPDYSEMDAVLDESRLFSQRFTGKDAITAKALFERLAHAAQQKEKEKVT